MESDEDRDITRIDLSHTVSVEEAVFQVIGIVIPSVIDETGREYSPTLDEILENILESADAELANARYNLHVYKSNMGSEPQNKQKLAELEHQIECCEDEFEKASKYCETGKQLYIDIKSEVAKVASGKDSILIVDQAETSRLGSTQITKTSFHEWHDNYGNTAPSNHTNESHGDSLTPHAKPPKTLPNGTNWEDLTIKLDEDQIISIYCNRRKFIEDPFKTRGLSNPKTNKLNEKGKILKELCRQKKHCPSPSPTGAQKKTMSELRNLLKGMTGLSSDPFSTFNPSDGWKPRFIIKSLKLESEKRARRETLHSEYDDEKNYRDFEHEDDPADQYLKEHDPDY